MNREPSVYVKGMGAFLPNEPVDNHRIEEVLGKIEGSAPGTKQRILRENGIQQRYYAIHPRTRQLTHTNAKMTAEAVGVALQNARVPLESLECLACGTSSPDQWMPGHGAMVHGELGSPPCEVVTTAGVCASGMTALKHAYLSVLSGLSRNAVATGSELSSTVLRSEAFQRADAEVASRAKRLDSFERDFLRWMLSDGAGAAVLVPEVEADEQALRIEWMEILSFANQLEPCMYWGGSKNPDGSLTGWREAEGPEEAHRRGMFHVRQDIRLLNREAGKRLIEDAFPRVLDKHFLKVDDIDWFLPHYSSEFFRNEVHDRFASIDFTIPYEKWFTNLTRKGNTGSASIYIILEELVNGGHVKPGQRILCFVPESARFTVAFVLLTAVG